MNLRVTAGSPVHCAADLGTTRWISLEKKRDTSGLFISRAPSAITAPSMLYRSTFLIGLCRPERGHSRSRRTKGPISSKLVSGTMRKDSPLSGSKIGVCLGRFGMRAVT
eukprot:6192088-Pleurochrysis_carterae.AAC.1